MADAISILDIARDIRSRLPELLGEKAETVDQALAKLLERAESGEDVEYEIRVLLGEHKATDQWKRDRLGEKGLDSVEKGFSPPAGDMAETPNAAKYTCPIEGCRSSPWFPIDVGDPVPSCKTHHNVLFQPVSNR